MKASNEYCWAAIKTRMVRRFAEKSTGSWLRGGRGGLLVGEFRDWHFHGCGCDFSKLVCLRFFYERLVVGIMMRNVSETARTKSGGARDRRLVQKERTPFARRAPVVLCAAKEFDLAVEVFHEAGAAKRGDEFAFVPCEPSESV